jgi:hypothetical protein
MDGFYLLEYLKQNSSFPISKIDLLKYELDQRIYYYGDHFKKPKENSNIYKLSLKRILLGKFALYLYLIKKLRLSNKKRIVSNAYFSFNLELAKHDFEVLRPIHQPCMDSLLAGNYKLYKQYGIVNKIISENDFIQLLSKEVYDSIESFQNQLFKWYETSNISSLIIPNDIAFYELLNINIFKELQRPSFIFLHGLPCRYNYFDENRSDYLIVWGEQIKLNYIKVGFNPDKILISGHPYYKKLSNLNLRNKLDDILILTKSIEGAQHRDKVRLGDRGNLILYLYSVQNVLQRKGIKSVRFRPHPSENPNWYFRFIDPNFFILDTLKLSNSLIQSTLVIGPASTVFLESIFYGVNYIVYEPTINDLDLVGFKPALPFDGSNKKVPVAKNEIELNNLITDKIIVDPSIFNDYIQTPFDISFMQKLT